MVVKSNVYFHGLDVCGETIGCIFFNKRTLGCGNVPLFVVMV
jgi:hypothetical protein